MNKIRIIGLLMMVVGSIIMYLWDSEYDFLLGFLIGGGAALLFRGKIKTRENIEKPNSVE